jgi:UPF0716 family protein affecting phage T7 exclusion
MLGYLILLFTAAPIIELALLIKIGQFLGVFYTVGIVIVNGGNRCIFSKVTRLDYFAQDSRRGK